MVTSSSDEFRFEKSDSIGALGAEVDEFLADCFVDIGDLAQVENAADRHVILVGRTVTGKTALLNELRRRHGDRVIDIKPDNLALTYIANSTILNFFSDTVPPIL